MLSRRLISIPGGPDPITFVGQTSTSGNGGLWTTSNVSVSAGDIVLFFSSGKTTVLGSDVTIGGTASLGSSLDGYFVTGGSGNDYLVYWDIRLVSSGGTVNLTENNGRDSAGFILALGPGATLGFGSSDTGEGSFGSTFDSVSVSGIASYEAFLLFETIQDEGSSSIDIPPLRSGLNNVSTQGWVVGVGGGAQGWGSRLSGDLSPNASYSYNFPSYTASSPYWGAVGIRISNA